MQEKIQQYFKLKTWLNLILSLSMLILIQTEYIITIEKILGLEPQEVIDLTQDDDKRVHVMGFTYDGDNRF